MNWKAFRKSAGAALLCSALLIGACGNISAGVSNKNTPAQSGSTGSTGKTTVTKQPATRPTKAKAKPTRPATKAATEAPTKKAMPKATQQPTPKEAVKQPTLAPTRRPNVEPTKTLAQPTKPGTTSGGSTNNSSGAQSSPKTANNIPGLSVKPYDASFDKGLTVQNVGYYKDSIGGMWFYGEVKNNSNEPKAAVAVEISLYNDRGERLARGSSLNLGISVLKPGQTSVWNTTMTDSPTKWAKTTITVGQTISHDDYLKTFYPNIKASDVTLTPPQDQYGEIAVKGKVTNTGKQTAHSLEVTAALYDPSGKLMDVNSSFSLDIYKGKQQVLKPGQTTNMLGSFLRPDIKSKVNKHWKVVIYVDAKNKGY